MKKTILILLGFLVILYFLLAASGIFVVYKNATPSNEPNIKEGEFIITTNLISPKPGDFVSYRFKHLDSLSTHSRIHRLVAAENDILEIKDGNLFVNGQNFDKNYSLAHEYKISINEYKKLELSQNKDSYFWMKSEDTITRFIDDRIAKKYNLEDRRVVKHRNEVDELIKLTYNEDWNKDNFGPIKVALDKVFIMADNRDISEDSRDIGLIDKSAITGVLIK